MELDLSLHDGLPYMGEGRLHALTSDGTRRTFSVKPRSFYDRDLWEIQTDIEEVGVTGDGRWLLVMTIDEGSEVREFPSREALCRWLWETADLEPAALHTLRQLGALRFDPSAPEVAVEA